MLRKYTPSLLRRRSVARQVQTVLSKVLLCRTATLKGHIHECPRCGSRKNVYNSCGDRHCPQCSGARRANWLDKTSQLVLPGVHYFQVVFTLPDKLSGLILGNRRDLYDLLFRAAWRSLRHQLQTTSQECGDEYQPAAHLVPHTWNQQLDHHPHIHALVPGGGPSLDRARWVTSRHPIQPRRRKPYLTDNVELGREFRKQFIGGLRRHIVSDKLRLDGEWSFLRDSAKRDAWLKKLAATDWNVFIEGPPRARGHPEHVLKYLARYMSGGPIADSRLIGDQDGVVTFWARRKDKVRGNRSEPFTLPGAEFVRRWTMHILPRGYTRSRSYGGYHGSKREDYLELCRELPRVPDTAEEESMSWPLKDTDEGQPKCKHCDISMECIASSSRPSWRAVFELSIYREAGLYSPMHHILTGQLSPAHPTDEYG